MLILFVISEKFLLNLYTLKKCAKYRRFLEIINYSNVLYLVYFSSNLTIKSMKYP